MGRAYKTVYPTEGGSTCYRQSWFNSGGQLWKESDPDNVIELFVYNGKGEREYTLLAVTTAARQLTDYATLVSQLSALLAGSDRATRSWRDVTTYSSLPVQRIQTLVWTNTGAGSTQMVSVVQATPDGRTNWSTVYRDPSTPVTTRTETVFGANGLRTVTVFQPDSTLKEGTPFSLEMEFLNLLGYMYNPTTHYLMRL